jgi:acetolactate synthase-1/2/3 large subunit
MAIALGANDERVEDISDLRSAITRASENVPAIVDVVTSQKVISSDAKKGLGFVLDYQTLMA